MAENYTTNYTKMKTFKDLKFKPHHNRHQGSVQARMALGDGLIISVVAGDGDRMGVPSTASPGAGHGLYNDDGTYEIAVFDRGDMTAISEWDDVIGWQTAGEIDKLLEEIQTYRAAFRNKCSENKEKRDARWDELLED